MCASPVTRADLTSESRFFIPALYRWKQARRDSTLRTGTLFPQGRQERIPLHLLTPDLDKEFLSSSFGKIVKTAASQLLYHRVVPNQTKNQLYQSLNQELARGIGYSETIAFLAHSADPADTPNSELRHTAVFVHVATVIQHRFRDFLKMQKNVEIQAELDALERHLSLLWKKRDLMLAPRHFMKSRVRIDAAVFKQFQDKARDNFIVGLISPTETRYLYIDPTAHTLYESGCGRVAYRTLQAMQEDITALLESDAITKAFVQTASNKYTE